MDVSHFDIQISDYKSSLRIWSKVDSVFSRRGAGPGTLYLKPFCRGFMMLTHGSHFEKQSPRNLRRQKNQMHRGSPDCFKKGNKAIQVIWRTTGKLECDLDIRRYCKSNITFKWDNVIVVPWKNVLSKSILKYLK
jgi:hypothetical protein